MWFGHVVVQCARLSFGMAQTLRSESVMRNDDAHVYVTSSIRQLYEAVASNHDHDKQVSHYVYWT